MSGCSRYFFIRRLPIDVLVLSSTQSSEPFFSLVRSVSVSSRFLRAVKPIVMAGSPSFLKSVVKRFTSASCVECI